VTKDQLATALDITFTPALKAWGCDFVRVDGKPWIANDPMAMGVYAGIVGQSLVVEEVRIGIQAAVPGGLLFDAPKQLTDAIHRAAIKANEFPPFYVE
jgi:hypothetical protein